MLRPDGGARPTLNARDAVVHQSAAGVRMIEFEFTDFDLVPAIVEALDAAGVDGGLARPCAGEPAAMA